MLSLYISKYFSKENILFGVLVVLLASIILVGMFLLVQVTNHLPIQIAELKTEIKDLSSKVDNNHNEIKNLICNMEHLVRE